MTIHRPTEYEALQNIKHHRFERAPILRGTTFGAMDWKYTLMVKHINFMLPPFEDDIVMQFDNINIIRVVSLRFGESYYYTIRVMGDLFDKLLRREVLGLPAIPSCTPYEEIIKHRNRLRALNDRYNLPVTTKLVDNNKNGVSMMETPYVYSS
jgi:hypothetical protein